ncbi:exodeoxyribonuclease VII large subunit [Alkaliphilus peptidifermentans]|uniref:Exodeoxyribonuclease 7 large subunit n=1 Tax=Alkaliphilus peptidifermentans DSM 18978 TaxID=1120976 RepID=A0A1G5KF89_9FIRM|nr:exodeoxyribonuclease VII large subunit [Alkaliphilus peptidifermentans]SCY98710.1 Exodeoxyribonuclease VII large subunit [Alkaliphilus peptidifermentans DSM 18978]
MQIKVLSVSEVNSYIKRIITADPILYNIRVKGEISNYKLHSSGHIYFTLKDESSRIRCVMFKTNSEALKFNIEEGMKVNIKGYVSIYERDGQYQLYVNEIEPSGIGSLYKAFQQLKERLSKEGLFDQERKKPIPFLPKKIGIVTSPTGSVIRDILSVIDRRFPKVEILLYPVPVQGENAAKKIAYSLKLANENTGIDLLIVCRGGGSIEELWPFNEEVVARAISESKIPVISAVGHETDFTIADFAADLRAPTPSAAAELSVPDYKELVECLSSRQERLVSLMNSKIFNLKDKLNHFKNSYPMKYPYQPIHNYRQQLDRNIEDIIRAIENKKRNNKEYLLHMGERLNSLSPLSVLGRGYSLATTEDGEILNSIDMVKPEDSINVTVKDGKIYCRVSEVLKEDKGIEKEEV